MTARMDGQGYDVTMRRCSVDLGIQLFVLTSYRQSDTIES